MKGVLDGVLDGVDEGVLLGLGVLLGVDEGVDDGVLEGVLDGVDEGVELGVDEAPETISGGVRPAVLNAELLVGEASAVSSGLMPAVLCVRLFAIKLLLNQFQSVLMMLNPSGLNHRCLSPHNPPSVSVPERSLLFDPCIVISSAIPVVLAPLTKS